MIDDRYACIRASSRAPRSIAFRHLTILIVVALVGCLVLWSDVAANEDSAEPAIDKSKIEEIVVTGTRIKRRDFITPSPLTTISRNDIAFSGQPTIEETLHQMPQVLPFFGRTSNNPGDGTAGVNLRGLGPDRSLVLLNGRRVAPSGTGNRVDLNNIPEFLLNRVEVITGGASAVYGSDALAGVINFITKEDYSGLGIETGFSMTEQGDSEIYDFNLAYGHNFANGHGNITVHANLFERKPLFAADRKFTSTAWRDDWEGNLLESGSGATPAGHIYFPLADFGNGPAEATFNPNGTPREFIYPDDRYNYAPVNYLQSPLTRYALGVMGHYDLTDRFEGYFEASFIRNKSALELAPVPAYVDAEINLDNPILTPESRQLFTDNYTCDVNLACIYLGRRLVEIGPRVADFERDYSRIVAGFKGELWRGWDIDGWVTYTTESSMKYLRNDASESRLLQGLLVDPVTNECFDPTGGCVPLNIFGEGNLSAAGVEFIRFADFANATERTHKLASVFVTGSPIDTWAGPLDMAVGVEWRSDDTYFESDDALVVGDQLGWNVIDASVKGTDEVFEIYAEAVVPLASDRAWADYLGLDVGARYSDYKLADGTWTYKAGAEWQPFEGLRLRAMNQRSVRAPNSNELFEEQRTDNWTFVFYDPTDDPCSASADPIGNDNVEKCTLQGLAEDQIGIFEATLAYPVNFIGGGNPDLKPETGETWTLGAVISPGFMSNWTFTIDYFALEVTDTIGDIDAALICFDPVNAGNVFCENIRRDATGNVAEISQLTSNRGAMETTGIDMQIDYQGDLPDFLALRDHYANLSMNVYWTHVLTNKDQENPVTEVIDCVGYFGWPCDARANTFPEDRVTTNMHYASGPLGLHLTWRWIEGTDNAAPFRSAIYGYPDPDLAVPKVGDKHYLDLGLAYSFSDYFAARFGVNNLLGNDPPQMANAVWSNNTDTGLYDVFGRSYYLTLSMQY